MSRCIRAALLLIAFALLLGPVARAEDVVWATGRVCTADGRHPLPDALVALYNDKNHVLNYARTDRDGYYYMAVPRGALHLDHKSRGFFHQVMGGVSRVVGGMAGVLRAGARVAVNAAPLDPLTKAGVNAATGVAGDLLAGKPRQVQHLERNAPGTLLVKVTRPGANDAVGLTRTYWMQNETVEERGREKRVVTAWLDPVGLTPAGSDRPSSLTSNYLTFTDVRLEPGIAEPGEVVRLTVTLPRPPEPGAPVVVVARNARNGQTIELLPIGGDRYRGEFLVDRRFPRNDSTLCVLAYAQQEDGPGRSRHVEDAIGRAGLWNPDKPYVYNPLLVVSRNRAEAVLTVVNPSGRHR